MQVWNVLQAARWKYRTQKIAKNSPFGHHCTTLSGYIFATQARIDNRKKSLLNSSVCPTSSQYDELRPLAAEISWHVWGTPASFHRFRVLAALLHSTRVVGVSQSLRHWTQGATYIWKGGHHVGHWLTFLLCLFCVVIHFFWLVNVCICCVRFSFSIPSQEICLGNIVLCEVGCKTLTQSISQHQEWHPQSVLTCLRGSFLGPILFCFTCLNYMTFLLSSGSPGMHILMVIYCIRVSACQNFCIWKQSSTFSAVLNEFTTGWPDIIWSWWMRTRRRSFGLEHENSLTRICHKHWFYGMARLTIEWRSAQR